MADPNYITPRGLALMRAELSWLEKTERPKIVAEVAWAASLGDRSENAEYHYGKKRLRQIDSRRRFLLKRLEIARPVEPQAVGGETIKFGATVTLADEEGSEQVWHIYGEDEVDVDQGILSWRSPLGRALMGKEEGDEVVFHAPGGKRELEVVGVEYRPCLPMPEVLNFGR